MFCVEDRKMIVHLLRTWAVLCLALGMAKAEVTMEKGAYRNLMVSFSPNLPNEDGATLLESMKAVLDGCSRVLHQALGVQIAQVTFLLPDAWDVSGLDPAPEVSATASLLLDADLLVEGVEDSPFGKGPLAMQFGGCGVRGSRITVPQHFLKSEEDFPKGKLLAREWLKYRYGVFDENGFQGDPRYPTHYTIPGTEEVKVTECTDPQVEYVFKDFSGNNCTMTRDSNLCTIHPGEMSAENVSSSLMFFHQELQNMEHVCGREHTHNDLSPSKQNILCEEKSIWKVLEQSPDFENLPEAPEEYKEPEFHYVKTKKPRVALLFETSEHLFEMKNELLFAVRRFLYELPEGSELSVHSFTGGSFENTLRPLSELGAGRGNIVPVMEFDSPAEDICPLCALDTAVDGLLADDHKDGSVILIVGSSSTREDNSALIEKLQSSQLCLKIITLKEVNGYSDLQPKCLSLQEIPESDEKQARFDALYEAMTSTLPHTDTNSPTTVVSSGLLTPQTPITIPWDPSAAKFTLWLENPVTENSIRCSVEDQNLTLTKTETTPSNIAVYSFEPQQKDVTCRFKFERTTDALTQVQMTAQPGLFFAESVWVHDTTPSGSEQQMPVVIYAKLLFGDFPVSDARVTAKVTDANGETSEAFELFDNGFGDPDITQGDGVYSRYFFNFTGKGVYQVSVEMNDNGEMTQMLKKGADRCCGSAVKADRHPVSSFSRVAEASFEVISERTEHRYPPARIIDLRVDKYEPPTLLVLKWTAPGGEVDRGKADRYILKSFLHRSDATENFETTGTELNVTQPPLPFGSLETVEVPLDAHLSDNTTHYLAVRAASERAGRVSNIVTISVPTDDRTTGDVETSTPVVPPKESGPDKKTIGIVLGVLLGVIVVSVCVYLVIYCVGRRKKAAKAEENRKRNVARSIGLNSIPADAIVRHHNEVVKAKSEHKDPPIFDEESLKTTQSTKDSKDDPEYSQVQKKGPELPATDPPKSPKRMTFV